MQHQSLNEYTSGSVIVLVLHFTTVSNCDRQQSVSTSAKSPPQLGMPSLKSMVKMHSSLSMRRPTLAPHSQPQLMTPLCRYTAVNINWQYDQLLFTYHLP